MTTILKNFNYFFSSKNLLILICIGNCLEFYCFSLFAYNFKEFNAAFFSAVDEQKALYYIMVIFSAGYYLRPLGSFLFGRISDIYSRRLSIIISSSTMAFATIGIGILPNYATLSLLSPIIFIFLRLVQGLSVGGEFSSAAIYLIENSSMKNRSFVCGCITNSGVIGFTLANWSTTLISSHFNATWAWRYTYIIAGCFLILVYSIRLNISESLSQKFKQLKSTKTSIYSYINFSLLSGVFVSFFGIFSTYTIVAALPLYLKNKTSLPLTSYEIVFSYAFISVFLSFLARKFCVKKIMRTYLFLAACICVFSLIISPRDPFFVKGIFLCLFIIGAGYSGLIQLILFSKFSKTNRYTLSGLSFSLSTLLLGGTAPLIIHAIKQSPTPFENLLFFILFIITLSFLGTFSSLKNQLSEEV